jgi:hypothetical protein
MSDCEEPDHDAGNHDNHDDMADFLDHFATAIIALRDLALNAKIKPAQIKKLARLERRVTDSQAKLAVVEVQARELVARAEHDVAAIRDDAQRRLEAAAAAEQELVEREQKIARLEAAWRNIGEPQDVMSGFRSPEYSPLQKARISHGQQPGKDPDRLLFVEHDAASDQDIAAYIRRDVGGARSDSQGNAFAPSTLTRSTEHKRGAA